MPTTTSTTAAMIARLRPTCDGAELVGVTFPPASSRLPWSTPVPTRAAEAGAGPATGSVGQIGRGIDDVEEVGRSDGPASVPFWSVTVSQAISPGAPHSISTD